MLPASAILYTRQKFRRGFESTLASHVLERIILNFIEAFPYEPVRYFLGVGLRPSIAVDRISDLLGEPG